MKQIASTQAKQAFGQLLADALVEPVAIERHGKVQAIVGAPRFFVGTGSGDAEASERRMVRLRHAMVEKDRLIRHQRIALDLVTLPASARNVLVKNALAVVERWRHEKLCSVDYIDRWAAILRLPAAQIATRMTSELDGWGPALRQNSPWVGVHA